MDAFLPALEHLLGFGVVVAALAGLWGITALNGLWLVKLNKPTRPSEAIRPTLVTVPEEEIVPDEAIVAAAAIATLQFEQDTGDLVIVAATVASMLGSDHRIVSIRPRTSGWGQQGRRDIHASHRIR